MRIGWLFTLLDVFTATLAAPVESEEGGTTNLRPEDFTDKGPAGTWLVKFFSPYCPHCTALAPKYEAAYQEVSSGQDLKWGNINCIDYGDFCSSVNIRGYPTLRIYRDGKEVYQLEAKNYEQKDLADFARKYLELGDAAWAKNEVTTSSLPTASSTLVLQTSEPAFMKAVHIVEESGADLPKDIPSLLYMDDKESHPNVRLSGSAPATPPAEGSGEPGDGTVLPLTGDYFRELVTESPEAWFVKFYSPRCPHCVKMAPAFEEAASKLKGVINVGEVNCEKDRALCKEEDIPHFPFLAVYFGGFRLPEYLGRRTAEDLASYAYRASLARIKACDNADELKQAVALSSGSAFVYLYDYTAMPEDWPPLLEFADILTSEANDTAVLRSADDWVRYVAGIHHRGPALLFAYILGAELYWIPYPGSAIPSDIRNVEKIRDWALNVRFLVPRELDPPAMTKFAPYVCLALTGGGIEPGVRNAHSELAHYFVDVWRERQIVDQSRLRADRFKLHDEAVAENDWDWAKRIMKTEINAPTKPDIAFAFTDNFESLSPGDVACVDYYNSLWIQCGHKPEAGEVERAVSALSRGEGKRLLNPVSVPRHEPPAALFVPPVSHKEISAARWYTFSRSLFIIVCVYLFYRLFIRRRFRASDPRQTSKTD